MYFVDQFFFALPDVDFDHVGPDLRFHDASDTFHLLGTAKEYGVRHIHAERRVRANPAHRAGEDEHLFDLIVERVGVAQEGFG